MTLFLHMIICMAPWWLLKAVLTKVARLLPTTPVLSYSFALVRISNYKHQFSHAC